MKFHKKQKTISVILLVLIAFYLSLHVRPNRTEFKVGDTFTYRTVGKPVNRFCGTDEVIRTRDNFHIATFTLCEENISVITFKNNTLTVLSSSMNGVRALYKKNTKWRWVF